MIEHQIVFISSSFARSDGDGDEEFDDDKISRIMLVTQPAYLRKHPSGDRTGNFTSRPKVTSELADVINEGLCQYERVRCCVYVCVCVCVCVRVCACACMRVLCRTVSCRGAGIPTNCTLPSPPSPLLSSLPPFLSPTLPTGSGGGRLHCTPEHGEAVQTLDL